MPTGTTPPIVTTTPPPVPPASSLQGGFPGYGQSIELGSNWRIKFFDADGIPLSMLSFDVIDFGAIAYKEIFQNVKTILATPLYSAALERLLGVDQSIVDLPMQEASQAIVAILDALYFWEPRVQVININFDSDTISGHLQCSLQLNVKNVIYGTETPYDRNNIFDTPPISQEDQLIAGPPGPPGPTGKAGMRGSVWFTGSGDTSVTPPPAFSPTPIGALQQNDMYLNTTTGDVFQFVVDSTTMMGTWSKRS